jgi:hypothetical protein
MMTVALIEDRLDRLMEYADQNLMEIKPLEIINAKTFEALSAELAEGKTRSLDSYNCIICHRSALNIDQRELLAKYCAGRKIPLVFFSGSISSSSYQDTVSPILYLNSKDLYSKNIHIFFEHIQKHGEINLLVLQFGERWKLSLLLTTRNSITYKANMGTIKRIRDFSLPKDIIEELVQKQKLGWLAAEPIVTVSQAQILELTQKLKVLINDTL